ncbi:MAG: primosomal protein N' [Oligoflexales bacterium]|nr:primosomal protein N' [Oligoflexales bacterium]
MEPVTQKIVKVAVPCPLPQAFSYLIKGQSPSVGSRVKVPFGPRYVIGIALEILDFEEAKSELGENITLKPLHSVLDEQPIFKKPLLDLGVWMSRYYFHPIGEVFKTMLPASIQKKKKETWALTEFGLSCLKDEDHHLSPLLLHLFPRGKGLTLPTLKKKWQKYFESNKPLPDFPKLESLLKKKICHKELVKTIKHRQQSDDGEQAALTPDVHIIDRTLTDEQQIATDLIKESICSESYSKPLLLWGVTGSGKTEVYLQAISSLHEHTPGAQTLVLVPEISLTPQITRVFSDRFKQAVAVVHSALSDEQRWGVWEQVRSGKVSILIGPRSSIFAPFSHLGLIIVDEEHDSSYKQNTNLRYHARDIAVLRAKMENACCILGSATPSLESFYNADKERYQLVRLSKRVTGAKLPEIVLIPSQTKQVGQLLNSRDLASSCAHPAATPISPKIITALKENLSKGHQAIVLVNRRGYAFYLFDVQNKEVVRCPSCSISLTLHKKSLRLKCHYCEYSTSFEQIQAEQPESKFFAIGYGSQKAEEHLKAQLPGANIARLDSDTAANRLSMYAKLDDFRKGDIDILVGTQILAKGHDFPKVTLTVLLDCDQMLNLPDFRSGEKTFQLMVQAAGRSGRGDLPGQVMIQSLEVDHPIVMTGLKHDYASFAETELSFRRAHNYPPFSRQILWELSAKNLNSLDNFCNKIEQQLEAFAFKHPNLFKVLKVSGPSAPSIERIMDRYRKVLLISATELKTLHQFNAGLMAAIPRPPSDIRLHVDVDPQSLL